MFGNQCESLQMKRFTLKHEMKIYACRERERKRGVKYVTEQRERVRDEAKMNNKRKERSKDGSCETRYQTTTELGISISKMHLEFIT